MIRTLGLYQPYASLMLHGKLESRWIAKGKKPPFPLGKYLLYATKKRYKDSEFLHLAKQEFYFKAHQLLAEEPTKKLDGHAIALGELVAVKPIKLWEELAQAFYMPPLNEIEDDENGFEIDDHILWGLHFKNVTRIEPFPFRGKQGVGFLSREDEAKLKPGTCNS